MAGHPQGLPSRSRSWQPRGVQSQMTKRTGRRYDIWDRTAPFLPTAPYTSGEDANSAVPRSLNSPRRAHSQLPVWMPTTITLPVPTVLTLPAGDLEFRLHTTPPASKPEGR